MSINRVNITGNLTRDPEMRGRGGNALAFGVAVNDRRKNQATGEWEDYPNFIDCVVFGRRAEALEQILRKGMKVAVEGKLRWSSWEADGQRRSKLEVVVDEVEFMTARPEVEQGARQTRPQQQAGGHVAAPGVYQPTLQPQADAYDDEDIPF